MEKRQALVRYVEHKYEFKNGAEEDGEEEEEEEPTVKDIGLGRLTKKEAAAKIEPFRKTVLKKVSPKQQEAKKPGDGKSDQQPQASKKKKKKPAPSIDNMRNTVEEEVDIWRMMANMAVPIQPKEPEPEPEEPEEPENYIISSEKESGFSSNMAKGMDDMFKDKDKAEAAEAKAEENVEQREEQVEEEQEHELVAVTSKPSIVKPVENKTESPTDKQEMDMETSEETAETEPEINLPSEPASDERGEPVLSSSSSVEATAVAEQEDEGEAEPAQKKLKCDDGSCFVKRKTNAVDSAVKPKTGMHKWFAPPKPIFKPMCEVSVEREEVQPIIMFPFNFSLIIIYKQP